MQVYHHKEKHILPTRTIWGGFVIDAAATAHAPEKYFFQKIQERLVQPVR